MHAAPARVCLYVVGMVPIEIHCIRRLGLRGSEDGYCAQSAWISVISIYIIYTRGEIIESGFLEARGMDFIKELKKTSFANSILEGWYG